MPPKHPDQHSSDDVSTDGDGAADEMIPVATAFDDDQQQELQEHQQQSFQQPEGFSSAVAGGEIIMNNPNDEAYEVNNGTDVQTPPLDSPGRENEEPMLTSTLMTNNPNDEMVPVPNADIVKTPPRENSQSNRGNVPLSVPMETLTEAAANLTPSNPQARNFPGSDDDEDDEDDVNDDDEDDSGYRAQGYAGQKPDDMNEEPPEAPIAPNLEYNPKDFAEVNAKASPEIQDLFSHISDFHPFVAELPTKLRPFIPDYIPAIGDLDPFVKIPRPDGRPDGLGLLVVDEPAIPQSNPAVVLLELRAISVHSMPTATVVDSFEDAANRPEVIDRWIADLKKVHYKKALPTVNYQKPMPEIENLMQVWPQAFEDVLNSDVPFPPPKIDLDLDQYVRLLCAVLDIPTYQSLIDSLHVMFTLYEDFRFNQHFQID